jgi:hypothetical protein
MLTNEVRNRKPMFERIRFSNSPEEDDDFMRTSEEIGSS